LVQKRFDLGVELELIRCFVLRFVDRPLVIPRSRCNFKLGDWSLLENNFERENIVDEITRGAH
jgi:hypothetical protein